ncbi:MAG: PDZ domain-containing protein, partial [Acidobacteriales bacterium]|nr:PDZ domain-containing protein [Terriglobales bacterium]
MNSRVRFILGIAFFALLLVYSAASFYVWLYPPGSDAGWYVSGGFGDRPTRPFQVRQIDPQGPAQELRPGDKIIAINGVNAAEHAGVLNDEYRLAPGSPYSMTVERNGQEMTFAWQTIPRRRGSFPWDKLMELLFWLSGLIVLSLKAEDRQAWLLALMLGSFSTLLNTHWQEEIATKWLALPVALALIGGLFSAPLLFHLFLYFPQPSPWLRR